MKNETIIKPLPANTVITLQGDIKIYEKTSGNLGVTSKYLAIRQCAYAFENFQEDSILLYTPDDNRSLRQMVSRIAAKMDHHVYVVDQLGAVGIIPAGIVILDSDYLSEWEIRYLSQLMKGQDTLDKHFIFTKNTPLIDELCTSVFETKNYIFDEDYLAQTCEVLVSAQSCSEDCICDFPAVISCLKPIFTGQQFIDAYILLFPQKYDCAIESIQFIEYGYPVLRNNNDERVRYEIFAQSLLQQLFKLRQYVFCLDDRVHSLKAFMDLKKVLWEKVSIK